MGATYVLLLSCLGFVITAQAQDCPKPTAGPNMILKDEQLNQETFPNGAIATFECVAGYAPKGVAAVTCTDGTWSTLTLRCELRNCGPAEEVANAQMDYSEGTDFGAKVVISCNPGYTLVGQNHVFCGAQGWLGRLPVCEVVACDPPASIDNGSFKPVQESYDYREVVRYSCLNDYTLDGPRSSTCSESGRFEPDPPKCTIVQCEDPIIENGMWIEGSRPPHRLNAFVKYQCKPGYVMDGSPTLECGINSQWSHPYPTCQKVVAPTKPPTTTTTTTTTTTRVPKDVQCKEPSIKHATKVKGSPPYTYKSTVTYQCSTGYEMKGKETLMCGIDGKWSSDLPHCTGNGNIALPVGLTVAAIAIGAFALGGLYYFGLPPFGKKKRGSSHVLHPGERPKDDRSNWHQALVEVAAVTS